MIVSSDDRWLVDGGVNTDQKSIWSLDLSTSAERRHTFADGWWVRLFRGKHDRYVAARYGNDFIEVDVLRIGGNASQPLARIRVGVDRTTADGDRSVWIDAPRAFAGFRPLPADEPTRPSAMLLIDQEHGTAEIDDLEWFQEGDYDHDYQGPQDPVELPGSNQLVIPVARSSRPVLYDPTLRQVVGHMALPDFGQVSDVQVGPQSDVIWAWGDGLLRVRARNGGPLSETNLTASDRIETTLVTPGPIADVAFDHDGARGAIGILHSGEVWLLDPQSLQLSLILRTGFVWPRVALLRSGRVIVRDAITGNVDGTA